MSIHFSSLTNKTIYGQDIVLSGISLDSRHIKAGDLFCAIKGAAVDGHQFISQAIKNGAAAILMQEKPADDISVAYAVDADLANNLGELASRFYAEPSQHLYVAGVTGTNGKSSVCSYISQILTLLNRSHGEIGTLGIHYQDSSGVRHEKSTINTTPDAISLQGCFAEMLDAGVQSIAMEVSSHALAQGRCNSIAFNSAVFTNLSHDHLDYHGTLEAYADAKLKLFRTEALQVAIINVDDAISDKIQRILPAQLACKTYSIADETADYYFQNIRLSQSGIQAQLIHQSEVYDCELALLGRFNCHNVLAAIAVVHHQGVALKTITSILPLLKPVRGRMQLLKNTLGLTAVVDYAHTPDALENVLSVLREITEGKIHLVFGCGGDRDQTKRPLMAKAAEAFADNIIVTADNPRSESLKIINAEIMAGFTANKVQVIEDRALAIVEAVSAAKEGDVVLIAGKGHEKYQILADGKYAFDDVAQLTRALDGGISC
ncbi:MAG: UDP-N-acetylmuramoyl-L-alanyl-D-glutamate--2,6-diaminopimelate ligase [Pseudomonadales bacterium]|nr:UDP-N-acetylmuramoyl-L-alanyl-D-glutamate--2,6-diaminopimelate ligase [Pseudomonadales bacterium]